MKRIVLLFAVVMLWLIANNVYGQNSEAERNYTMGYYYQYGENGYPKDAAKAMEYYTKAADLGKVEAYNSLGNLLYGQKDYTKAFNWFKKSADAGNANGQYYLAYCFRYGNGTDMDSEQALNWFRASANGGCQHAYVPLGRMLEKEKPDEAFAWYKKSAEAGYMDGQYNLAMCYINGTGTNFNDSEAKKWMEKSADQGYSYAKEKLSLMNAPDFKKKPIIDFYGLPNEATNSKVKFDVKIIADNGRITKTAVYLNGQNSRGLRTVKEDGYNYSWQEELTLREGPNTIRVEATNRAGTGTKEFVVTFRPIQKATVTWTSFETSTYDAHFPLKATINSDSKIQSVSLIVNEQPINIRTNGSDNQKIIDETILLLQGNNKVKLSVINNAGIYTEEKAVNYIKREKRLALVIGNSNYTVGNSLKNPINDATDMKEKLSNLGFEVLFGTDANKAAMKSKVDEFGRKAQNCDVALFFYAGHGMQSQGKNFLIPVTADIKSEADIEFEGVSADWVLKKLNESQCKAKILFLDACRDNPYARSWYRGDKETGLAQMKAPKGTFIGYSTGPDEVAKDGEGRNSPFTEALLKALDKENLELKDLFDEVGMEVQEKTGQTPWMQSMFYNKFYFNKK